MTRDGATRDIAAGDIAAGDQTVGVDPPRDTSERSARLIERLRGTEGLKLLAGEPLSSHTTFRIGGPAEVLAEVADDAALVVLLETVLEVGLPFELLGMGSNVLAPDRGVEGVVARLVGSFQEYRVDGDTVEAGGALALARLARRMAESGLRGLEALAGFPSTVGGAVWMNAGCYGVEIKDVLVSADVVERTGEGRTIPVAELGAGYRTTALQRTGTIVTRATFRLEPGDATEALARIDELNRRRWQSLPSGHPNAGSIFQNPVGDYAGRLIEACGLKGTRSGGAAISSRHANVIVNEADATAEDVLALMRRARKEVAKKFGVDLEPEIVLLGSLRRTWANG